MLPVLVFDVNGTLLDIQALAPQFQQLFGTAISVREWFREVLHHSLVLTLAGDYVELGQVAKAVLEMTSVTLGAELDKAAITAVTQGLLSLPPFPEVTSALDMFKTAGFRLATLTNSSAKSLERQLANAGLTEYFEQSLSVDQVRRYKPAPEPYHAAAQALQVPRSDLLVVAAHGWDVFGAMRAGCRGAFIARPGETVFPLGPEPDYFAQDLLALAQQIVNR